MCNILYSRLLKNNKIMDMSIAIIIVHFETLNCQFCVDRNENLQAPFSSPIVVSHFIHVMFIVEDS
jgi:hypothetical protein